MSANFVVFAPPLTSQPVPAPASQCSRAVRAYRDFPFLIAAVTGLDDVEFRSANVRATQPTRALDQPWNKAVAHASAVRPVFRIA
jgi:hypothetical protein